MSVEFEEEQAQSHVLYSRFMPSNQLPKLVGWVIKAGIVKNENQANYFLIGLAVVAFLVSVYLFLSSKEPATTPFSEASIQNYVNYHESTQK
jgi:hypothetical protein